MSWTWSWAVTVDRVGMGLTHENVEGKVDTTCIREMGGIKGEFPQFLAHVPWLDDGATLEEIEPGLVKKTISDSGLVHDGIQWDKCHCAPAHEVLGSWPHWQGDLEFISLYEFVQAITSEKCVEREELSS